MRLEKLRTAYCLLRSCVPSPGSRAPLRSKQYAVRNSVRGALLLCGVSLGGCASVFRETAVGPNGLAPAEQRLRDALADGRWEAAVKAASSTKRGAPRDRLLRDLFAGTAAYYAGRWEESADAFERAASLADDRYTKSASRAALALTTNDLALPYVPGQNERLLVHYYALLAWLRRGSLPDAAVEARRLGFLMQQYDAGRTPLDGPTRALLRYVSGAVFAAAGDANDAAVAFRNARALDAGVLPDTALLGDDAPDGFTGAATAPWDDVRAASADSGDVLVLLEQGFVAHRVEQRLAVRGRDDGAWRVFLGAGRRQTWGGDALARAASLLTGDEGVWADAPMAPLALDAGLTDADSAADTAADRAPDADGTSVVADSGGVTPPRRRHAIMRALLTWPAYRRAVPQPPATLVVDSGPALALLRADLSAAEAADFERDRAARLARLLVRTALREAAVSELDRKHHEIASLVRSVSGAVERADTRSWHLLPGVVGVTRVRLPVGEHAVAALVDGARVSLGTVRVTAGGLALASARVWRRGVTPAPALSAR